MTNERFASAELNGNIEATARRSPSATLPLMQNRRRVDASAIAAGAIDAVLDRFGIGALRVAAAAGVRVIQLHAGEA